MVTNSEYEKSEVSTIADFWCDLWIVLMELSGGQRILYAFLSPCSYHSDSQPETQSAKKAWEEHEIHLWKTGRMRATKRPIGVSQIFVTAGRFHCRDPDVHWVFG